MKNVIGQVATGANFFNRREEQRLFWDALETDNLLLLAPRRVGKTSLMRKMEETAASHEYRTLYADVSDCGSELAFVERLYHKVQQASDSEGLWQRIVDSPPGKLLQRIKAAGAAGFRIELEEAATGWADLGEQLAQVLSGLDERWFIQIDELPVFVLRLLESAGRERVHEFLYWLRRLRLEYRGIRWLLAGSVGLDTVTARLNLADTVNDLRIVTLGAFDETTADEFLSELAISYEVKLTSLVRRHIIARCGWPTPYYLHLIFGHIRDCAKPSTHDVDRQIEDLLSTNHKGYFDYWRQRLQQELGQPDSAYAVALLNAVCCDPEGASRDTLSQVLSANLAEAGARAEKLSYLLDILYGDGYLVEAGERWRFRFPLLREFWRRHVERRT
jgi:hypothetical protein